MLFQDIFSCVFFKIFLDQSQWHHFQTPSWTSNTLWVLLCCNSLQTRQTCTYLQRGVFWFLRSDVFMLPVHFHFYGPQALFSVRRDVRTLCGLVHQRICSLQLFHVPQRHQWNHRFANVWSFFRIRVIEDKDVQVLEDGKEWNQHECTCAIQPRNAVVRYTAQKGLDRKPWQEKESWETAMLRKILETTMITERQLTESYDKRNTAGRQQWQLGDSNDKRKKAGRWLWQEKDSWQIVMTGERQLTESIDKR